MGEQPLVIVSVNFGVNRVEAYITLRSDPVGTPLTLQHLQDVLAKYSVVNGIDMPKLVELAEKPDFYNEVLVAKGTNAINGEKASLRYTFELKKSLSPKVNSDGTVNFKDLGIVQTVKKGDLLVEKTPATAGTPGLDVCNIEIPPVPGKDISIPAGRNVVFSEDKLQLFADIDGQVDLINDRVSVLNTYTVGGDVSVATGNIDFNGNVVIKKDVQMGFTVKATGNVEVYGVVDGGVIIADGDIIINNGFNGGVKGELIARGNITTKFIQGGSVVLGGVLETTYIYNAKVRSGSSVRVMGKGTIIGGHVIARTKIDTSIIGSESLTPTVVEVGSDPDILNRYREMPQKLEQCRNNIKAIESAVGMLRKLNEAGKLPPDKREQYEKTEAMISQLTATEQQLSDEYEELGLIAASFGKGSITVRNTAYPGVKLVFGAEQMLIKSKYMYTTFSRDVGRINILPVM